MERIAQSLPPLKILILMTGCIIFILTPIRVYADNFDKQRSIIDSGITHFDYENCVTNTSTQSLDVTAGTGVPSGLKFPSIEPAKMAGGINEFIQKNEPSSPFKGLGATIVATAKQKDVSPFLIVGIGRNESQLGTDGQEPLQQGNNAFGRFAGPSQKAAGRATSPSGYYKWPSFKTSVDYKDPYNKADPANSGDMASFIRAVYAEFIDSNDLPGFLNKYAPPHENDTVGYAKSVASWINEMVQLSGTAAPATIDTSGQSSSDSSQNICGASQCDPSQGGSYDVVLDPGHGGKAVREVDEASGIVALESTNTEERKDMWDVAQTIKQKLEDKNYRVGLTKQSDDDPAGMIEKSRRANEMNPKIAVSLHSTPGNFGKIPSDRTWGVTPQEVGRYREYNNRKKTFDNSSIADKSKQFANLIAEERTKTGDKVIVTPLSASFRDSGRTPSTGDISIVQLFATVPWVYNEVGQSGLNKQKYAEGIANGIIKSLEKEGAQPASNSTSSCAIGGTGDAVKTALDFAWPTYHPPNYLEKKPAYAQAVDQAKQKGWYVGGGDNPGIDCGGFVTLVMKFSGADADYNKEKGAVSGQISYIESSGKYEKIGAVSSTSQLKPGDIAFRGDEHTFMYVGQQPNFKTQVASASYSEHNTSWRSPMAGVEDPLASNLVYYRLKGQ